jgi:hypothetical protein
VIGALLLIFAMLIVGPIGLFAVGAIWSAISGWALSDEADLPAEDRAAEAQASS